MLVSAKLGVFLLECEQCVGLKVTSLNPFQLQICSSKGWFQPVKDRGVG